MKHKPDPIRLSERGSGVPAELASALRAVRSAQPDAARVELLKQRFAADIAMNGAAGSAGIAATLGAKCLPVAFALVTGATALTWLHAAARQPASSAEPAPARAAAPEASNVGPGLEPAVVPAPVVAPEPAPEPAPAPVRKPVHRVRRARTVARAVDSSVPDSLAELAPAPLPDAAAEMAVLWNARTSLERDPRAALELTQQHASAYPDGVFAQEREVLAIEALLKLRQTAVALERAARFLQRYPESAHAQRLQLLVDASTPRDP